jgi:hypothetical protein
MNTNPGSLNRIPRLPRHTRHLLAPLLFELDASEGDPRAADGVLERIDEIAGHQAAELLAGPRQGGPR